jgi:hypothetical protein
VTLKGGIRKAHRVGISGKKRINMFYRVYQFNGNYYPSAGYNLEVQGLRRFAGAYLESICDFEMKVIEGIANYDELNAKVKEIMSYEANQLVPFIENFLGKYDGNLRVEQSEELFPADECSSPEELVDGRYYGQEGSWFIPLN